MATTNFDRYDLGDNVREDLRDAIYNIAPTQTPFMTMAKRGKASNTYTEYQTDDLQTVDPTNAKVDGADAGADTSTASVRIGNTCQISDKVTRISGRSETVDKAGRRSEMAYQLSKAGRSIKRDMEAILTSNQAAAAGDSSTASTTAGLRTWFTTNNDDASDAVTPGWAAPPGPDATTPGTPRGMAWSMVDGVVRSCYDAGGEPDCIMCSPTKKQAISSYLFTSSARVAALYSDQAGKSAGLTAQGAVDVYISDFGVLDIVPNRFLGHDGSIADDTNVYILEKDMWEVSFLRSFRTKKLAVTGDAENRQLLADYALISRNEAASGVIGDLTNDPIIP